MPSWVRDSSSARPPTWAIPPWVRFGPVAAGCRTGAKSSSAPRVEIVGRGAEEPVSDNDKPKGRLTNRRVEIKLYVPPR